MVSKSLLPHDHIFYGSIAVTLLSGCMNPNANADIRWVLFLWNLPNLCLVLLRESGILNMQQILEIVAIWGCNDIKFLGSFRNSPVSSMSSKANLCQDMTGFELEPKEMWETLFWIISPRFIRIFVVETKPILCWIIGITWRGLWFSVKIYHLVWNQWGVHAYCQKQIRRQRFSLLMDTAEQANCSSVLI